MSAELVCPRPAHVEYSGPWSPGWTRPAWEARNPSFRGSSKGLTEMLPKQWQVSASSSSQGQCSQRSSTFDGTLSAPSWQWEYIRGIGRIVEKVSSIGDFIPWVLQGELWWPVATLSRALGICHGEMARKSLFLLGRRFLLSCWVFI